MKAIHNERSMLSDFITLLLIKQRYKMKAIHNRQNIMEAKNFTVVNKAKIQNESNSQLLQFLDVKS